MPDAGDGTRVQAAFSALASALTVLVLGAVLVLVVVPAFTEEDRFASLTPGQPVHLSVPSLDIRASVVPVALTDSGVLDPPADPTQVGWWQASARPGQADGQTVVAGHTVHTGGGAMDRLGDVRRGARIDVRTRQGTMRYRVSRRVEVTHVELADRAHALFGQRHGAGRLVLVTCTNWNGSYYEKNVVVFGHALGEPVARDAAT